MKLILDTNVLIDALHDQASTTWQILELATTDNTQFFASDKIIKEYNLVVERQVKNNIDKKNLEKFISQVEVVPVTHHVKAVRYDPEDDKFINTALSVNANYIISSDNHLLDLQEYNNIKILSPKDFYYFYKNQDNEDGQKEWADIFWNVLKR
jgi:putative PIN family toxin of toxin-antitoxin system